MSPARYNTRCLLCGDVLPVADGRTNHCKRCRTTRCIGCGHLLAKHTHYIRGGVNHRGSTLVCSVDNCMWTECREALRAGGETK